MGDRYVQNLTAFQQQTSYCNYLYNISGEFHFISHNLPVKNPCSCITFNDTIWCVSVGISINDFVCSHSVINSFQNE